MGEKRRLLNEVWTVDFMGWWRNGDKRCEPLTVRDEYSRYLLEVRAVEDGRSETQASYFAIGYHLLPKAFGVAQFAEMSEEHPLKTKRAGQALSYPARAPDNKQTNANFLPPRPHSGERWKGWSEPVNRQESQNGRSEKRESGTAVWNLVWGRGRAWGRGRTWRAGRGRSGRRGRSGLGSRDR